jgi:sugar phosphate isomerase/epimerase
MKIGFNLLLYTGHVTEANYSVIEKLKATGYDGVEVPIFDVSNPAHFKGIGQVLKDNGLECTAVTVLPDEAHNAISPVAANRQGAIDHLQGVGPDQLKIRELIQRVGAEGITEVILCTNPNLEGEATALYLTRVLDVPGLTVSRIASGIPIGGELEYADRATLGRALTGRQTMS